MASCWEEPIILNEIENNNLSFERVDHLQQTWAQTSISDKLKNPKILKIISSGRL